jgi:methyl-accepting chemotaxis protein
VQGIAQTIGSMTDVATAIASAVEQQSAATQEIARSVQEAAQGTGRVTANITEVRQAATETGTAAGVVLAAAHGLSVQARQLSGEVHQFVAAVQAA